MYVELRITAEYGNKQRFVEKLSQEIGVSSVSAEAAVQKTVFQRDASSVIPQVVAAEQIQHKAIVLYFLEGSDTIVVHVDARTVAETKQQAVRIARRSCALFENPSVKTKAKAVIYAVNSPDFDTAIIAGRRLGRWRRFVDAFTERWLARIVTWYCFWIGGRLFARHEFFSICLDRFRCRCHHATCREHRFHSNAGRLEMGGNQKCRLALWRHLPLSLSTRPRLKKRLASLSKGSSAHRGV